MLSNDRRGMSKPFVAPVPVVQVGIEITSGVLSRSAGRALRTASNEQR